jgi:hypothetical protein
MFLPSKLPNYQLLTVDCCVSHCRNGVCPRYCTCAILYEELLEDACKDVRDHYAWNDEYPTYAEYMVAAQHAYWKACRERLCCHLDENVRLPDCVIKIVHDYIAVNGSDDESIPAQYLGRAGTINVPIEIATQAGCPGSPEGLSVDDEVPSTDSKPQVLWDPRACWTSPEKTLASESRKRLESCPDDAPIDIPTERGSQGSPEGLSGDEEDDDDDDDSKAKVLFDEHRSAKYASRNLASDGDLGTVPTDTGTNPCVNYTKGSDSKKRSALSEASNPTPTKKKKTRSDVEVLPVDDVLEDPVENDPKFKNGQRVKRTDPQLTLTQLW